MTEFHITADQGEAALMRDILRLIAHEPTLEHVVSPLVELAVDITDAEAGFYLVFESPRLLRVAGDHDLFPEDWSDESLKELVNKLEEELYVSANVFEPFNTRYQGWLLMPVRMRNNTISVLCLLFESTTALSDEAIEILSALVDGLRIVTVTARNMARQETSLRNQNEFVRIVSHDLRTPLTSIQGFASMLETDMMGELNEKQHHFVDKILAGVAQMTSLVDNIQDAGRFDPETGFYEMERIPTDLVELVRRIVDSNLLPAEKQELTVVMTADDDIPILNLDSVMLERSITNLVDNAIKYTPNGGKIEVKVRHAGGAVVISVSDNGYGISPEHQKNLFQRHYRIRRREHRRVRGSGLGLFIVRSVALQHQGDAWVESEEGKGSIFSILLPLSDDNIIGDQGAPV